MGRDKPDSRADYRRDIARPQGKAGGSIARVGRLGDNFESYPFLAVSVGLWLRSSRFVMVFPNIEKMKQEYTDKYVMVDPQRPELARFADVVGQVKTVNMSGRALVEFLDYHLNIAWYDIELEYLKVVDKPLPKPKEEKKPAPKAEAKPAAAKEAPAAVAKPQAAGKPSTADILAKLKGGGGAAPAAAPAAKKEAPTAAPATGKAADRGKMSVADMIAAAKGGGAPTAKAEPAPVKEEAPAAPAPAAEAASPKSEGGVVKIDRSGMSVDQMVAYCREKDAS
jgi:pyruvate/2-oxoglutarate dehydrogenase complex dihydrolipoamide acyltransferase (E2) component